jgi:hypothetical protein
MTCPRCEGAKSERIDRSAEMRGHDFPSITLYKIYCYVLFQTCQSQGRTFVRPCWRKGTQGGKKAQGKSEL